MPQSDRVYWFNTPNSCSISAAILERAKQREKASLEAAIELLESKGYKIIAPLQS